MKKAFGEYQRLARGALGFSSLWLGEDHLLCIKGSGFLLPFSEEYRRFRYRDIQSVAMAKTSGLWLGVFGYLAGLAISAAIGFAFLFARDPGDAGLLAATLVGPLPLTVLMLALLIRHLVLGPRCLCEVRTALKRERLRPLTRLHRGREAMARLGEKIRASQADLAAAAAATAAAAGQPKAAASSPPHRARAADSPRVPPATRLTFQSHAVMAGLLILMLHVTSPVLTGIALAFAILGAIPLLIALAGSVRHPAPDSLRNLLWFQLIAVLALGAVASVYYIDQAINDPALTVGFFGPINALAEVSALGGLAFYLVFLIIGLANLAVAVIGLERAIRWRGRIETSSFVPGAPATPDLPTVSKTLSPSPAPEDPTRP